MPETFKTGFETITVHDRSENCQTYGCVIHNPSKHPMSDFPLHWRYDVKLMERICPHGVGHPDPDAIEFTRRSIGAETARVRANHGCDGCCA
jgi:hypothetical protein